MVRDATRASRPYSWARMKGPVPMGRALSSTAVHAQTGGMENTPKASRAVTAGCTSSLAATTRNDGAVAAGLGLGQKQTDGDQGARAGRVAQQQHEPVDGFRQRQAGKRPGETQHGRNE